MKFVWIGLMTLGAMMALTSCTESQPINTTKETITIGGSAEAYEVMEVLTEAYEAEAETIQFKFRNSSQSSGGIQGVKDGILDIGLASRELTESEKNYRIQYRAIANSPMLLATHESIGSVTNLTSEQIKGIYSGEISNWQEVGGDNAEIILLDLPEDENEKQLMRQHYLGNIKVTSRAILIPDDDDVLEALTTTPYSIGTVPKEEEIEEISVNPLTIDGVSATPENIRNGQYKLVYKIGMVFATDPPPATQEFINYIFSEAGQQELAAAGYVVINQP